MTVSSRRSLLLVVGITIILTGGIVHGLMSGRWGGSGNLAAAGSRLALVPRYVGDWQASQDFEIPARELKSAGISTYVSRLYVNQRTGQQANLLLVCGVPGRIAVHTPDICLQGAGHEMLAPPKHENIAGSEFWSADFSGSSSPSKMNVVWGWTTDGHWRASSHPRYDFAGKTYLYKMYVARPATTGAPTSGASNDFLEALLPSLNELLADAGEAQAETH